MDVSRVGTYYSWRVEAEDGVSSHIIVLSNLVSE